MMLPGLIALSQCRVLRRQLFPLTTQAHSETKQLSARDNSHSIFPHVSASVNLRATLILPSHQRFHIMPTLALHFLPGQLGARHTTLRGCKTELKMFKRLVNLGQNHLSCGI